MFVCAFPLSRRVSSLSTSAINGYRLPKRLYSFRAGYWPFMAKWEDEDFFNPPASEKPMYRNLFDQAEDPKLFQVDRKQSLKVKDLRPTDDPGELVSTTIDPLRHYHLHPAGDMMYSFAWEPVFPRTPNLSRGELAAGATVTRTAVWHSPNEPAVQSVGRFEPQNFRPAGFAENNPEPDSAFPDMYPKLDEYRLPPHHADRRALYYLCTGTVWGVHLLGIKWVVVTIIRDLFWDPIFIPSPDPLEIDLTKLNPGDELNVKLSGTPYIVRCRTDAEIQRARKEDEIVPFMKDPEFDEDRFPLKDFAIMTGICTHLGCIPHRGGVYDGWYCPCHGSQYDSAGRIRGGPAPRNLPIPEYTVTKDQTLIIGVKQRQDISYGWYDRDF